jgi:hypothetical protein
MRALPYGELALDPGTVRKSENPQPAMEDKLSDLELFFPILRSLLLSILKPFAPYRESVQTK